MWRRTATGSSLGAGVIALLFLAAQSENGAPIALAATALVAASVFEVSRMGNLRGRKLEWVLPGAASAALFLCWDFVGHAAAQRAGAVRASYLSEALLVAVFAGLGHLGLRLLERIGEDSRPARGAMVGVLVLLAFITAGHFYGVSPTTRIVLLTATSIGLFFGVHFLWSEARQRPSEPLQAVGLAVWIALPLPWLWHVWERFGVGALVSLIVLSKIGDVAGYFGGNAFGRHHPFPRLSPGKTLEGCVASLVATVALGGALAAAGVLPGSGFAEGLVAGLVVNLAAQSGDLLESWIKRRAGVKDSSDLLGSSGGVLDVLDSVFLTVPAAVLAWPFLLGSSANGAGV